MRRRSRPARGFTFVEILAAMLFMAIVIPVALHGLTISSQVGSGAARKRHALELAERTLNEALVTQSWRLGNDAGDYGEDWPNYRWELTSTNWDEDAMLVVSVTVFYRVQGREISLRLETLEPETEPVEADLELTQ